MRRLMVFLGILVLSAPATAAVDPRCEGVVQENTVNLSGGVAGLCIPSTDVNGTAIPDGKTITCTVKFVNSEGVVMNQVDVTGGPGGYQTIAVPRDGQGSAELSCSMDGMVSEVVSVGVVFPAAVAPATPVLRPGPN